MNSWKRAAINALRHNSGYRARYHEQYALAFNVKLDYVDSSTEGVIEALREGNSDWPKDYADKAEAYIESGRLEWDAENAWQWALEDVQRSLEDGEGYNYVRPDVSKKFGLDSEGPFDVSYTQTGRSGGYIALTQFEHRDMNISNDELIERLESNDNNYHYTGAWCQKLCAFITECGLMFNSKTASKEVMYQLAFRMGQDVDELVDEDAAAAAEAEKVRYWHERDVMTESA